MDSYFFLQNLFCFSGVRKKACKTRAADDVAVPDDAFLTELTNMSLQHTIADIQVRSHFISDSDAVLYECVRSYDWLFV